MNRRERRASGKRAGPTIPAPSSAPAAAPAAPAPTIDLLSLALQNDRVSRSQNYRMSYSYNNRGIALRNEGRPAEAMTCYEMALTLKPDNAEACNNLGVVLQDQGRLAEALSRYRRALSLKANYAEAHNNMGGALELQGKLEDAAGCYKRAVALRPDIADLHFNLANALRDLGKRGEAIASYERAIALGHPAAQHMAAALKGETTEQPPAEYVVGLFDGYAPRFEADLVGRLGYKTPGTLRRMIDAASPGRRFVRTVDLGCGTGLMGAAFRDLTDQLVGVDIAPKMVEQSAKKAVYDRLEVADIVTFLEGEDRGFDLFLAAEVLVYLGSLDALFTAMASRARPEALLAFSAEISTGPDYELTSSGRYAQSRAYLEAELSRMGARVVAWETHPMRLENGKPVDGDHVIAVLEV